MKEERKIGKIIPKFISGYLLGQFKVGWKSESHSIVYNSLQSHGMYSPQNCPGQNTGVGSLSLLQGIFPTQGWNPGLPRCRRILYQLSHKGNLRILDWVAYPFSCTSSQPTNWTSVCCIAGGFFTNWGKPKGVGGKAKSFSRTSK